MHVVLWDTRKLDVSKDFAGGMGVGQYPRRKGFRDRLIRYFYSRDRRPVALLFAHLAAIFRRLGHTVRVCRRRVVPAAPTSTSSTPRSSRFGSSARRSRGSWRPSPAARVLVVGTVASVMPEAFADLGVTVVKGEAEQLLWKLDEVLERPGATVQLGVIEDLDSLPLPDWSPFGPRRFRIGYDFWRFPTALIQQSRGCTLKCNYCPYLLLDNSDPVAQSRGRGRRNPPRHPALGLPLVQVPRSAVRAEPQARLPPGRVDRRGCRRRSSSRSRRAST